MVLVTGGTGLVGSHLLFQLVLSGTKVRALYRTPKKLEKVKKVFSYYSENSETMFNQIDWVQADILDIPALEIAFDTVEHVFHSAAFISFDPNDFDVLQKTNVEGTANIVNLCLAFKIKKLCHVSTIAAIGRSMPGHEASEENEWTGQQVNVYARTKHAAEMEVWRGSQENLDVVIVNPGIIIGPGFWETGSGKFFKTANKEQGYYPPGGSGFVAVADVVKAMLSLMESDMVGERFILVSENLSFKEILSKIAIAINKKPPTKALSIWQLKIGRYLDFLANVFVGSERKITKNTLYSLQNRQVYNSDKVKKIINLEFEAMEQSILFSAKLFIGED